jgi:hypothetical protein
VALNHYYQRNCRHVRLAKEDPCVKPGEYPLADLSLLSDYSPMSEVCKTPHFQKWLELRIDYGPGYRVYFTRQGNALVIILAGGDKGTQAKDIQTAIKLAHTL